MNSVDSTPQLSIVVPTFNERENVSVLLERLGTVLAEEAWEVIFVDDNSPDETWAVLRALALKDPRVRCLRRIGRRGLSGACIEGMLISSSPFVAVMDADLQHDEARLPDMLNALRSGRADLVIGSRYIDGGSVDSFSRRRLGFSRLATMLAKALLSIKVTDPMSGFFMMRRQAFEDIAPKLSVQGFKILLDIIVSGRNRLRVVELPYEFRSRMLGDSKLDSLVALDFIGLLLSKLTGDLISLRFLLFALVGSIGLVTHFATLYFALYTGLDFPASQSIASVVAMTGNFILNNLLTYRDQRLRGWAFIRGLLLFYGVCGIGLIANVGIASSVFAQRSVWWLAGAAGALVGVMWNYAMSSFLVWRRR
ncbi:glycosyltransferase family 2 protein [Bradyrhizobium sp. LHD-71]|uniref:glycosyltransferase family 2 protein n=1 Tax=Bradyrhizobium sp. LHD-71 TaxID=3072141 RepID=UPI00280EAB80|nr:glycosyltransferase family 2 protein [Bradyrhizobium sp. LHD-71]MDQ8732498.1 glycosyltransferase family 2 protein [Bradyrhizobium sp. LHD-71]